MTHHVVLSGGLDSTCALALTVAQNHERVTAISFDYGQRHHRELIAAAQIANYYGIEHTIVGLTGVVPSGESALVGATPVPDGHYAEDSMKATVVPGRNLLFAAAAVAQAAPGDSIIFGVHAGDHPIYPDCRPEFWADLADAVERAYVVAIETPFVLLQKSELLGIGLSHGAPVEHTWSCYKGGEYHCGRCGTCVERAEAFHLAGFADPTVYDDNVFWREAVSMG
jgi:7-cyano-7-deazaguanine synthase